MPCIIIPIRIIPNVHLFRRSDNYRCVCNVDHHDHHAGSAVGYELRVARRLTNTCTKPFHPPTKPSANPNCNPNATYLRLWLFLDKICQFLVFVFLSFCQSTLLRHQCMKKRTQNPQQIPHLTFSPIQPHPHKFAREILYCGMLG